MRACNICGSSDVIFHTDLTDYPVTNLYRTEYDAPEFTANMSLYQCDCGHVYANSEHSEIYNSSYGYDGVSRGVQARRLTGIQLMLNHTGTRELNCVVDIGGGQLEMLLQVLEHWNTNRAIAVDPVPLRTAPRESSIEFHNEYFDGGNFSIDHVDKPNLFIVDNVLEHIRDLDSFVDGIEKVAGANDLVYVCVPSLEVICRKLQFQDVIHEHINYFATDTVQRLFAQRDFLLVACATDYSLARGYNFFIFRKGGGRSQSGAPRKSIEVAPKFEIYKTMLSSCLSYIGSLDDDIYGLCASELTPTLAHHMGTDLSFCKYILDTTEGKENKWMPTIKPQIKSMDLLDQLHKDTPLFITAPLIAKQVVKQLAARSFNNVILPLPVM